MSNRLTQAGRARLLEHDLDELAARAQIEPERLHRAIHGGYSLQRADADRLGSVTHHGYAGLFRSCVARERKGPDGASHLPAAGVRLAYAAAAQPDELYRALAAHGWIELSAAEIIADAAGLSVADLFEIRSRDNPSDGRLK